MGTGEEEVGVEDVGNLEVDKGLDNIVEDDDERDCDDERVEVDSWIDSDADCLGDSDGEDWGYGNGGTEGVVDVEIDVDYGQGNSNQGLGSGEVGPSSQNHDSQDSASETEHDGISGYFVTFKKPKSMADYRWEVGTTFVDKEQFVDGVRTYDVHAGRNLKFDKNDKERVRVRCLGA